MIFLFLNIKCWLQNLQQEQLDKIKELEREVVVMRGKHSHAIQQMKINFLTEKKEFQQNADQKIQAMAKQANKVRKRFLFKLVTKTVLPVLIFNSHTCFFFFFRKRSSVWMSTRTPSNLQTETCVTNCCCWFARLELCMNTEPTSKNRSGSLKSRSSTPLTWRSCDHQGNTKSSRNWVWLTHTETRSLTRRRWSCLRFRSRNRPRKSRRSRAESRWWATDKPPMSRPWPDRNSRVTCPSRDLGPSRNLSPSRDLGPSRNLSPTRDLGPSRNLSPSRGLGRSRNLLLQNLGQSL